MKRFLIISSIYIAPIIISLSIVNIYLNFYIIPNQHGDLERLSDIIIDGDKVEYERLTSFNCDMMKDMCVDLYIADTISIPNDITILTIGDSFSENSQINKRYSNFTANTLNSNVYNLKCSNSNPLQIAATALNNGLMEDLSTACVVVETAERLFWDKIDSLKLDDSEISILSNMSKLNVNQNKDTFILRVKTNIKRVINYIKLQLSRKTTPTMMLRINTPRFSIEPQNLYVYMRDVRLDCSHLTNNQLAEAKEKLLSLQKMYADKGIKLIFLIAADKYGMYQDDIINNPYPLRTIATQLSAELPANFYVNSKEILRPYIENGVLDIYYATDSHWSPIAAEIIGNHIANMLNDTAK